MDQRLGVTRVDVDPTSNTVDAFVLSFVGTPNAASVSRHFHAQSGLWTADVNVRQPNPSAARIYDVFSAVPVAQVGDDVGGHVVQSVQFDPLAAPAQRGKKRKNVKGAALAATNSGAIAVRYSPVTNSVAGTVLGSDLAGDMHT